MKTLFAIAAVAVSATLFVCASPIKAEPITRQAVVDYSDLNVSREPGAQVLINRLEHTASHVCGGKPVIGDIYAWGAYQECTHAAVERAVDDIDQPAVNKLYRGESRRVAQN